MATASILLRTMLIWGILLLGAFAPDISPSVGEAAAPGPLKIRIGYGELPTDTTPLLFQKSELLKHYGKSYTPDFIQFRGGSAPIPALAAKELDMSYISFPAFASTILRAKLDLRIVAGIAGYAPGYGSPNWVVLEESNIQRIEDLRGKVLGTNALGTGIDFAARVMLLKAGLKYPGDYTFVEVNFPNQEAMLRGKKLDMAVLMPPFWPRAKAKGGVRLMFTSLDAIGPTQMISLVARAEFLEKNRTVLQDFFADYRAGLKWFLEPANLDEALGVAARFMKRPVEDLRPYAFQKGDFYHHPEGLPDVDALQKNLDLLKSFGQITERIEVNKYVDLSFITGAR